MRGIRAAAAAVVLLSAVVCLPAAEAQDGLATKPVRRDWALRENYNFRGDGIIVYAFTDKAELWVTTEDERVVLGKGGIEIELADGTKITSHDFESGKSDRMDFDSPVGPGTHFFSRFPARDGLALTYRVAKFKQRANLVLEVEVENVGTKPIDIVAIRPLVVPKGEVKRVSADTTYTSWPLTHQGGAPMFGAGDDTLMGVFQNPSTNMVLGFGLLPLGVADSGVRFTTDGQTWEGGVYSDFSPGVRLNPGDRLMADPVWLSYLVTDLDEIAKYYVYALGTLPNPPLEHGGPKAWTTGDAWGGIGRTLAPLGAAGGGDGLTIDPLVAEGGDGEGVYASADGTRWVNPFNPDGRERGKRRLAGLKRTAEFAVCAPSAIPDDALKAFNISRAQADRGGLEMAGEAFGKTNVFPAPQGAATLDPELWDRIGRLGAPFETFTIGLGPLRLDASGSANLTPNVLQDIAAWGGPIELTGDAGAGARKQIADAIGTSTGAPRPKKAIKEEE